MNKVIYKITRHQCSDKSEKEPSSTVGHSDDGYSDYIAKHGMHFSDSLAEYISVLMKPTSMTEQVSISSKAWTVNQIKDTLKSHNLKLPSNVTIGDIAYAANMYRTDFYPDIIKDKLDCVNAALTIANDVDGYEGQIFNRWLADAKAKNVHIDWKKYM